MSATQIGDVRITRVVEAEGAGGTRFLLPDATPEAVQGIPWLAPHYADEQGRLVMSIHSWVLETPTQKIVIDTGLGNDKLRDVPHWNQRSGPFLDDLTAAGFAPETIDLVICTHLHVDHVGWNTRWTGEEWVPTFPNARYLFGRLEWEYWREREEPAYKAVIDDSVRPIVERGLVDFFEFGDQLTPELRSEATVGHSIGHASLWLESQGERALITGDFLHHPCQAAHPEWCSTADWDKGKAEATRRHMLPLLASEEVPVYGMHWGSPSAVEEAGGAFRLAPLS